MASGQFVAKPNGDVAPSEEPETVTVQPPGDRSWWSFFPSLQNASAGSSTEEGEDVAKSDSEDHSVKGDGDVSNPCPSGADREAISDGGNGRAKPAEFGAQDPNRAEELKQDELEQQQQQQQPEQELAVAQEQGQPLEEAPDVFSTGAAVCSIVGSSVAWTLFGGPIGGIVGFVGSTVAVTSMGMTNTTASMAVVPLAFMGPVAGAVGAVSAAVVMGANSATAVSNYVYGQDTVSPTDETPVLMDSEDVKVLDEQNDEAPRSSAVTDSAAVVLVAATTADESAEVVDQATAQEQRTDKAKDAIGYLEIPREERLQESGSLEHPDKETVAEQNQRQSGLSVWSKLQNMWPSSRCASTSSTPSCFCMPLSFPTRAAKQQRRLAVQEPLVSQPSHPSQPSKPAETGAEVLSRHIKEALWSPTILLYETTAPSAGKLRLTSPTSSTSASSQSTAATEVRFGCSSHDPEHNCLTRTESGTLSTETSLGPDGSAPPPAPRVGAKLIEINGTGEGTLIDNDYFQGTAVMMHRPPDEDAPCIYRDYFATRGRCWELRVQGRFKTEKVGRLFAGVELPDYDYSEQVGVWSTCLARTCQAALQRHLGGGDLRLSYGSRGADAESSQAEIGEIISGLAIFDRIVESTGTPPPIGGDLEGLGILRSQAKNWLEVTHDIERRLNTSTTYTFCFWGASRFVDLIDEKLKNLGLLNCCLRSTVLGGWPPHIVLYAVDDSENSDDDVSRPMPRQPRPSEKRYMMDLMICNSRTSEMSAVCDKYEFQDSFRPTVTPP